MEKLQKKNIVISTDMKTDRTFKTLFQRSKERPGRIEING